MSQHRSLVKRVCVREFIFILFYLCVYLSPFACLELLAFAHSLGASSFFILFFVVVVVVILIPHPSFFLLGTVSHSSVRGYQSTLSSML